MSYLNDWTTGDLITLVGLGVLISLMVGILIGLNYNTEPTIEEQFKTIKQLEADCKIPSYYYIDTHRAICDKIGVIP